MLLFVEDEARIQQNRKLMLQCQGHRILTATNTEQALDIFSTSPVRVVVLECGIPRVNSIELADCMKRLNPEVKIIMVTPRLDLPRKPPQGIDLLVAEGTSVAGLLMLIRHLLP